MVNLNINEISKIGNTIQEMLQAVGVEESSELIIKVDPYSLTKIDEDLYYRQNPQGKDFNPTEDKVIVTFPKLTLVIEKREPIEKH